MGWGDEVSWQCGVQCAMGGKGESDRVMTGGD